MRETRIEGTNRAPFVILVVFGIVMAFLGYEMMEFKRAGKQTHGVEVRVSPAQLTLHPNETHRLEATILGSENSDIGWSLREGEGAGKISASAGIGGEAIYSAPSTPGVYHVIASSKADETRSASAVITVTR